MIEDEGGKLDPLFALFVLQQRLKGGRDISDFYKFSGRIPAKGNRGAGTNIIHSYFNEVSYYRSKGDGLIIHMEKKL
jgi:hypothetical protein